MKIQLHRRYGIHAAKPAETGITGVDANSGIAERRPMSTGITPSSHHPTRQPRWSKARRCFIRRGSAPSSSAIRNAEVESSSKWDADYVPALFGTALLPKARATTNRRSTTVWKHPRCSGCGSMRKGTVSKLSAAELRRDKVMLLNVLQSGLDTGASWPGSMSMQPAGDAHGNPAVPRHLRPYQRVPQSDLFHQGLTARSRRRA